MSTANEPQLCSGQGKYHTNSPNAKNPRPYVSVTLSQIKVMAANPQSVPKESAQWAIFSTLPSREHAEQKERGQFFALWADIDAPGDLTFSQIVGAACLAVQGQFFAYASRSATETEQKARLIVPLAAPVPGDLFVMLQKILNDKLEAVGITPDRATERAGQVCYLPNRGAFYDWYGADALPVMGADVWAAEIAAEHASRQAAEAAREAQHRQALAKAQERMASGSSSPVEAFNAAYDVALMLDTYGYERRGNRWLSPNSQSGAPAVQLTSDGRKWLSAHSSDAGIGRPTENGTMGDAFDLFVHYQHGGDYNAAMRAAGDMFTTATGETLNQAHQAKQQGLAGSVFGGGLSHVPTPPGKFSLAQFALNGQAAKMEAAMLEDTFAVKGMAIVGQSTVFYAKPNTGKTLLLISLLIEAIESGEVDGEDVFYINADDNHKGLTFKLILAERYGFQMLAPGYNGFTADMLASVLAAMIQGDSAREKVLILDTVKKFTDIMRKDKATAFGEAVRQFVMHGGTVIMLAHVNKHRSEDGKVIYSGTSDLVDDADCAYTLDTVTECKATGKRTVKFENFKSRGDVQHEAVYEYNFASGLSYQARLDSVRRVSGSEQQEVERRRDLERKYERNREAVEAISDAINDGHTKKTDLITAAMNRSGASRRDITRALSDHAGDNLNDFQFWTVSREDKNANVYTLNKPPATHWPGMVAPTPATTT
jgi:hypothetical protein